MKNKENVRILAETGILVAVAVALDYVFGLVSPFRYGGSISPAMVPIFMIAVRRGWKPGIAAGLAFGILQSILNMYFLSVVQYALDYLVAFAVLGAAGFVRGAAEKPGRLALAFALGAFLRYLAHGLSGVWFWGMYAPEGVNVWFYSFILYNLPYMAASAAFSIAVGWIMQKRGLFRPDRV